MNYIDCNPYLAQERNQQMQREVNSLRLEELARQERASSGSRFVALACGSALPLLRGAGLIK